jgi:hypothetical protein
MQHALKKIPPKITLAAPIIGQTRSFSKKHPQNGKIWFKKTPKMH